MSEARDNILKRLRAPKTSGPRAVPENPVRRFHWTPEECRSRFTERMEAVRGEVHPVGADWPRVLHESLKKKGARNLLYPSGTTHGVDLENRWRTAEGIGLIPVADRVEVVRDQLFRSTDAALTGCLGAVAETGSLVLWPTPQEPRLMSLVPPIHFVLLDAARILSTFHEMLVEEGWVGRGLPTNALLISGPSKSADIEQTLAYGVHGPRELIVLIRRVSCDP